MIHFFQLQRKATNLSYEGCLTVDLFLDSTNKGLCFTVSTWKSEGDQRSIDRVIGFSPRGKRSNNTLPINQSLDYPFTGDDSKPWNSESSALKIQGIASTYSYTIGDINTMLSEYLTEDMNLVIVVDENTDKRAYLNLIYPSHTS